MDQKRKVILMVVLLAAIPVLLWWQLRLTPEEQQIRERHEQQPAERAARQRTPVRQTDQAENGTPAEDLDLDILLASVREVDFDYEAERSRNPMRPLVGPTARAPMQTAETEQELPSPTLSAGMAANMTVTGIVWDERRPVAVINNARGDDEIVYPGYVFTSGVVVEEIEANRVLLRVNESLIPIELEDM